MAAVDMRASRWWMIGLWLCYGMALWAGETGVRSPQDWLKAMTEAMQKRDYQATVVYSHDNRIRTLALAHVVRDGVVYEVLQALDGVQRKVIRAADRVSCYFPDRGLVIVETRPQGQSLFNSALPRYWEGQDAIYRFRLGERDRVAGREAQEIVIEPLDRYRYGRRIWIDLDTFLPLKFELFDHQGKVMESLVVTHLETDEGVTFVPQEAGSRNWKVLDRREESADGRWRIGRMPEGFREVRRSRHLDLTDGRPVDHILISDGWASVSVYVKPDGGKEFDPGSLRLGAVNLYSRHLNGHLITVLGDVPAETVRLIGEGVHQSQP